MTNGHAELTSEQEHQLRECYDSLLRLSESCEVPAVRAAARKALAELHVALDGQVLDLDFYSFTHG